VLYVRARKGMRFEMESHGFMWVGSMGHHG